MATPNARRPVHGLSPRALPARPMTIGALEALLDPLVPAQLAAGHVAGAAVALVRDNEVLFSRGYGSSGPDGQPVDAGATLFRVGSVSKLLTWTAVMQLIERGILDESADIGPYLDFPLPRRFPEPITLLHLMTHSAGFESNNFGYMAAWSAEEQQSLGATVSGHVPVQVRRPGELPAYSNWGAALAGLIVERAAGTSFDEYVEHHVLEPLAMARSTFREPIPASIGAAPIGFIFDGERLVEHPFEYYHGVAPAGSLTTTAVDMASFMRAHLDGGRAGGQRILSAAGVERMHARLPGFHPHLDGATRGFYETWRNGRRTIGHQGACVAFESRLTLMPEAGLGIFVVCNTGSGSGFCDTIVNAVIDRFFPATLPDAVPLADFRGRACGYRGQYRVTCRSHTKSEKLFSLVGTVDVRARDDRLVITGLAPDATEWLEAPGSPGVFRRADGQEMIAFRAVAQGRWQLLGPAALSPAERVGWVGTPRFTEVFQLVMPVVFSATGAAAFLHGSGPWPAAAWLALSLALVNILIVGGIARTFNYDQYTLAVSAPWPFTAALGLGLASALLTLAVAGLATMGWLFAVVGPAALGAMGALAIFAVAFAGWLKYWNLIGVKPA